jgi:hypothetical protein
MPAAIGPTPEYVPIWSLAAVEAAPPVLDGTVSSEREAAGGNTRIAKAANTKGPCPPASTYVAAFLLGEHDACRNRIPSICATAIRYLRSARIPDDLHRLRGDALTLVGFVSARRRAELA